MTILIVWDWCWKTILFIYNLNNANKLNSKFNTNYYKNINNNNHINNNKNINNNNHINNNNINYYLKDLFFTL